MIMSRPKIQKNVELIETMRLNRQGQIALLALHLQRLTTSALKLGFSFSQKTLLQRLAPYLHQNYTQAQRLRVTLNQNGVLTLQCHPLAHTSLPVWLALAHTSIQTPTVYLEHKTTQRSHWAQDEQWLQQHPTFFDVIHYNEHGFITEGCRCNIYVQQQSQWFTPPVSLGLLPGVQRAALLKQGLVQEKNIHIDDLASAQNLRISNALRGWLDAKINDF